MNALRVFIPFQTFSKNGQEEFYLQKLENLLSIAEEHNIHILLALFDFPVGFGLDTYASYNLHLEKMVNRVKDLSLIHI